jgi:DNA invertase Pin-like site-specific DNA recombinase
MSYMLDTPSRTSAKISRSSTERRGWELAIQENHVDELQRAGVEFVSLREGVDTAGPMGRAVTTIMGERAGIRRARLEGRQLGRPRLELDRERILADRHELGYSLKKIAKLHGISKTNLKNAEHR